MAASAPTSANHAAYLTAPGQPLSVQAAPFPELTTPHSVRLRARALAVNPADWIIRGGGLPLPPSLYPALLGFDAAGEVDAVGAAVTRFRPGDRVCAVLGDMGFQRGAFAEFLVVEDREAAPLPPAVSFAQAAVLPVALSTAAAALFGDAGLGVPVEALLRPAAQASLPKRAVLIWGGRTAVGSGAIQLAVAAGLAVATTAGASSAEYCRELGARWVFDYAASDIEEQVAAALDGYEFAGALDAWSRGSVAACARVVKRLGGTKVQTVLAMPQQLEGSEAIPEDVKIGFSTLSPAFSPFFSLKKRCVLSFQQFLPQVLHIFDGVIEEVKAERFD